MKLAVHMSMFCKEWTDDISPYFAEIKEMGFDGVEISLFGADFDHLGRVFRSAAQADLEVLCGTGIGVETDVSSKQESVRQAGISYLKSAVELAAQSGAPFINGVLYAPWQCFCPEEPREERYKRSAESLWTVGSYAAQLGVGLNCEVLNRFESDFINTLDQGSHFLSMIDLPNVRLLADTFHMNIEEDNMEQALRRNIQQIGCIHICENHRGVPGTGHLDWAGLVAVLKQCGYAGYLDMETFVETGTTVGRALGIWRSASNPPLVEAGRGIAYIKALI